MLLCTGMHYTKLIVGVDALDTTIADGAAILNAVRFDMDSSQVLRQARLDW